MGDDSSSALPDVAEIARNFTRHVPHSHAMGMRAIEAERGMAVLELPFAEHQIGDATRGFVHTSVTTSLIDSACGLAVFLALPRIQRIATLDLRVDYLRPAVPPIPLRCRSTCFRRTDEIAFVRATAWQDSEQDPVAVGTASFMIGRGARTETTA